MPDEVALDTDVLLKAAAYRIAAELVELMESKGPPAVLGLTHLIAAKQLARKRDIADRAGASAELEAALAVLGRLEPYDDEIALAADLATMAQERGLPLDGGEAQLVAIVARRGLPLMVTGDKRALRALAELIGDGSIRASLAGRLACFEQVMAGIAGSIGAVALRARVCAEPDADGAMRLAFSCGRDPWETAQFGEACVSFVGAVKEQVGDLLAEGSVFA